jgi:hypothetical protein
MASLYISEFPHGTSSDGTEKPADLPQPSIVDQKIAIAAGSTQSAPFNVNTRFVLLQADAVCSIAFGPVGTVATAANMRLPIGVYIPFGVIPGQVVANITNA